MWGTGRKMDIAALRKVFAKYVVCADNYLAPTYTECFKESNFLINNIQFMDDKWKKIILEIQSCLMQRHYQHMFRECEDKAKQITNIKPAEGLMYYAACAKARAVALLMKRRPEVDVSSAF